MDAGNFPTYEKIINTTPLPRTRQENGLFLLEISFDPAQETRSVRAAMCLGFGAFGDVCRIDVEEWRRLDLAHALPSLTTALGQLSPPAQHRLHDDRDRFTVTFLPNEPVREHRVTGTLVLNASGDFAALLAPLK